MVINSLEDVLQLIREQSPITMERAKLCELLEHRLYGALGVPCPCLEAKVKDIVQGTVLPEATLDELCDALMLVGRDKAMGLLHSIALSKTDSARITMMYLGSSGKLYEYLVPEL